ncbi:MAG: preprotein translocase subunit YajC [Pseudomonadota bacterium]
MLINQAFASDVGAVSSATGAEVSPAAAIGSQFLLILALVALFYVLLIMPQKKRFKEHKAMLDGLQKGDSVVTAGGLVGKIEKISDDSDEVVLDMGHGTKVTALRSTIHQKHEAKDKKANKKADEKADEKESTVKK